MGRFNILATLLALKQCSQKAKRRGGRTETSEIFVFFSHFHVKFLKSYTSTAFSFNLHNFHKKMLQYGEIFCN